ncbi:MAG: hypothetical protein LBK68_05535 [Candidatus Margulisbacteria bacterium]|jgi:hypothetical protein|nr:hypothetical protein [Candidatus Margulisiibacteriota bacterium]
MARKFLALLILLVLCFSAGLGFWYLSFSAEMVLEQTVAVEEFGVSSNIRELTALLENIYDRADFRIDAANPNNLRVIVDGRLIFKFGQPVDLAQKYDALLSVLQDIKDDLPKIQYVDVSSYRTPAVR